MHFILLTSIMQKLCTNYNEKLMKTASEQHVYRNTQHALPLPKKSIVICNYIAVVETCRTILEINYQHRIS